MAINLTDICAGIQKSIEWCQGQPEYAGIRPRAYYIIKSAVLKWPQIQHDEHGRVISAIMTGDFVLKADAVFRHIDIVPDKSQYTSEPQGEIPSQTQLNKLTLLHPGVGPEATAACGYINNSDCIFIVQDMKGRYRLIGSEKWMSKCTVNQDLGQGAAGNASTTINVEASDEISAPFYTGILQTEAGEIDCSTAIPDISADDEDNA